MTRGDKLPNLPCDWEWDYEGGPPEYASAVITALLRGVLEPVFRSSSTPPLVLPGRRGIEPCQLGPEYQREP